MLFEFSHMDLSFPDGEVWCHEKPWKLTQLKQALTASQRATAQNGWYPIFFENHDQPRCVNHFFPKDADRTLAAKAIATVLLTTRGTPFIYQGQEIGLQNVAWPSIDCYNDISSHGQFKYALKEGLTNDEALAFVHKYSRDNARTPMQWTRGRQAGFTEGQPWLPVQEDYRSWCVEAEATNENSVLTYYRRLVRYRRDCDILRHGTYRELLPESEQIYAFERELDGRRIVTLVNFSLEEASYPEAIVQGLDRLDGSYPQEESHPGVLRPLEAVICASPEEDLMKEDDE
jgi:alpha-glucosidase